MLRLGGLVKRSYRTRIAAAVLLGCASAGVDAAAAVAGRVTVTVTNGRVTSEPAGIDCADGSASPGPVCAADFSDGTTVHLHAVSRIGPESKSTWSGACTHTGGPISSCAVTVAGDASASVRFQSDPIEARLGQVSVVKAGSGTGVVTSAPGAIVCGDICHSSFAKPTTVTLTASPSPGSVFTGWAGSCASYGAAPTCVIEVAGGQLAWTVSATFDLAPPFGAA